MKKTGAGTPRLVRESGRKACGYRVDQHLGEEKTVVQRHPVGSNILRRGRGEEGKQKECGTTESKGKTGRDHRVG